MWLQRDDNFYEIRRKKMILRENQDNERALKLQRKLLTYRQYEKIVRDLTEKQPLFLLSNIEKRHFTKYHVDHIISIMYGYDNDIPVEIIADITNLQVITAKENMIKIHKSYCIIDACGHLCKK